MQEFYILRIPLAHIPPESDTEDPAVVTDQPMAAGSDFGIAQENPGRGSIVLSEEAEEALATTIRSIQHFMREMNSAGHVYRLRFIDVSDTSDGDSAEALFMLTNFRRPDDMSMYLSVPRLNTLSRNQWQIRQWSHFYTDFRTMEVQRASWSQVAAASIVSNTGSFVGLIRGLFPSSEIQPEAEQNEQDARYRLLPIPGFSGMIMEETRL